mmetsp:Transcript_138432/g.386136  ORF Transcript_138432/g.386136 Transcript_138432/m.386136 type:complete len:338 (-) Transcript_138432:69-1082(-)
MVPPPEQLAMQGKDARQVLPSGCVEKSPAAEWYADLTTAAGAVHVSRVATGAYHLLVFCHLALLWAHWKTTGAGGAFFTRLAAVEVCIAFDVAVYAAGDLSWWVLFRGCGRGLALLEFAGRARLLMSAIAWVWLVPWAAELCCRCTDAPPPHSSLVLVQAENLAMFICAYFGIREMCFFIRGEPASALDTAVTPRFGDCLPSNALLGGQFRIDKVDLEQTGRIVFVPARPRAGLYVASGLAMCSHLAGGTALCRRGLLPPWWLLGSMCALLGRKVGDFKACRGRCIDTTDHQHKAQRRLQDVVRLACRAGELWWMACCVKQLQQCEANALTWQPHCK